VAFFSGFWEGVGGQEKGSRMRKRGEKLGFGFHGGLSTLGSGGEGLALLYVSSVCKATPVNGEFASRIPTYAG
jgi:hypothetical protein